MPIPFLRCNQAKGSKRHLDFNYEILRFFDLWPSNGTHVPRNSWRYFRSLLPALQTSRLLYSAAFHAFVLIILWHNPKERTKEFVLSVGNLVIVIKLRVLMTQKERIAKMFDLFEEMNGESTFVDEECETMRRKAEDQCRLVSKYGLAFFLAVNTSMVFGAFAEMLENVFLPLNIWYGEGTFWFYVLYAVTLLIFVLSSVDMFTIVLLDVTLMVIVIQIICQFKILRYKLENLKEVVIAKLSRQLNTAEANAECHESTSTENERKFVKTLESASRERNQNTEMDDDLKRLSLELDVGVKENAMTTEVTPSDKISVEMEKYLKNCVKHHETLIRCCSETQSIFNPALTFQIILTALLSLLGLFISIMVTKEDGEFDLLLLAVVFFIAGTSEFCVMCIYCDKLTETSSSIWHAAYSCDWFEATEGFKQSLRIIISRTSKPIILKASGIPLSLPTFRAAMRAVYYGHTMTLNMLNGKKIKGDKF